MNVIEYYGMFVLQDTLNPVWHRKLVLEYHFEERQLIQFKVFDRDSASEDLQVWDSLTR
jgi:hypothetical protein